MDEQEKDAIIQRIIQKVKTDHIVSISAIVAELKGLLLYEVELTEENGITTEELRSIRAKITALYKNKYQFEVVEHSKPPNDIPYVEYFVSKNPNYNQYNIISFIIKHPVWTLIGTIIAGIALYWQISHSDKGEYVNTKLDSTITPTQKVSPINADTLQQKNIKNSLSDSA